MVRNKISKLEELDINNFQIAPGFALISVLTSTQTSILTSTVTSIVHLIASVQGAVTK
jgi:hypothetical protein